MVRASQTDVVIVGHNGAALLPRALDSLNPGNSGSVRCIVVDNRSADGSRDVAAAGGATVVALPINVGYGAPARPSPPIARSDLKT